MSEEHQDPGGGNAPQSPASPKEMRLHPERPIATRLSRKELLGLGGVVAAGIAATLFIALRPHSFGHTELYDTGNQAKPEGLSTLPRDYTGLPKPAPRLGPPLPGDLGKPILDAGAPVPVTSGGEQSQQAAQERDAALKSRLFVQSIANRATTQPVQSNTTGAKATGPLSSVKENASAGSNLAFLNAPTDHRIESPDRLQTPSSPYVLQAGSIIPAALITGLRSDLPGEITAQVTQAIYDSPDGETLLIPQGAKLVGLYNAQVSFGQSRAMVVWTRLIMPNGASIVLERQPGVDSEGYAGLADEVDNHWGMLFKAAILSTVLSVGSQAGTSNSQNNLAEAIREGSSQSFSQVGAQVVGRSLDVQPTITIRPGFPVNVLVTRDLVLAPYTG